MILKRTRTKLVLWRLKTKALGKKKYIRWMA